MIKYGFNQVILFKHVRKSFSIFQQIKEPIYLEKIQQQPSILKKNDNSKYTLTERKTSGNAQAKSQGDYYANGKYTSDVR